MQFWVTFDDEQSIIATYEVLREQGVAHYPLTSCEWCKSLADITDKYGVRWMLNAFQDAKREIMEVDLSESQRYSNA